MAAQLPVGLVDFQKAVAFLEMPNHLCEGQDFGLAEEKGACFMVTREKDAVRTNGINLSVQFVAATGNPPWEIPTAEKPPEILGVNFFRGELLVVQA